MRNAGARIAGGEILCFVDADSRIHVETFNVIERALTGRVVGGATGVALERWSLGIAVTYAIMVALVWIMRMDTGVVFCRRADFEAIGGYREDLPAAEDVMFLWALRKLGKQRGQRLTRARKAKAIASMRKFDRYGDWHYLTLMPRALPWLIRRSRSFEAQAREYWYSDRR
ncbi:MAG: hypothetical protein HY337_09510 [Gemmatimonadetes bacterium]|nr:hypothetical protein [Gemmatimonadota bacterium]